MRRARPSRSCVLGEEEAGQGHWVNWARGGSLGSGPQGWTDDQSLLEEVCVSPNQRVEGADRLTQASGEACAKALRWWGAVDAMEQGGGGGCPSGTLNL